MDEYDKKNLEYEIQRTKKILHKLENIPENATLVYTGQGEVIVGYDYLGKRYYI
jgi:chaperonin cofactor prefoldin